MTRLTPDDEFRRLCVRIAPTKRTLQEWRDGESDDEFQSEHYVGGFDATEDAMTFSHYDSSGAEWWFQLTLDEVQAVADGEDRPIEIRPAE